ERPDLDPEPLHVFSRISRLARHLELARRAAFASRGLEPWAFDVLSALRRAGAPYELTPGVLMSQTLVSSGTVTNRIDRPVEIGERPDLDPEPLHVFSRISRLARHLELARRAAFASRGLEPWAFDVLSALRRAGAPYELTPGVLMSQTLVSSGTMTNRIDRLV